MNDFQKQLVSKHTYKGYASHFSIVYMATRLACIILLGISAIFSAKFIAGALPLEGDTSMYIGGFLSVMLAVFIGMLTGNVITYWYEQHNIEPLLATVLLGLVAFNVLADFNGSQELGASLVGDAPIDAKTGEISGIYTPQIERISSDIEEVETKNFYWCKPHQTAHRCKRAGFYIHPTEDADAVAKIEALKQQRAELTSTMNTLLSQNGDAHMGAIATHSDKLDKTKSKMKFGSLICTSLYLLLSMWGHKYGRKAVVELTAKGVHGGHATVTPRKRTKSKNKRKQSKGHGGHAHTHSKGVHGGHASIDDLWEAELDNNPDLAEEVRAMKEKEARGKS